MSNRSFLERRIDNIKKRVAILESQHGDRPNETHNYFGGWTMGYWKGKLSAYEIVKDIEDELIWEEFWVLERSRDATYFPHIKVEYADECNCSSLSYDHVCTTYNPELTSMRFSTKEEAEAAMIGHLAPLRFTPVNFRMSLRRL